MLEGRRRREVEGYLVSRSRGKDGAVRWYGDFRAFEASGGGREALVSPGHSRATQDKEEALLIAENRLNALQKLERTTAGPAGRLRGLADSLNLKSAGGFHGKVHRWRPVDGTAEMGALAMGQMPCIRG